MFDKLFPFYFVLDRAFRIVQKGSSLSKIVSDTENFDQVFIFRTPTLSIENSFESVLSRREQIFIIEIKGRNFMLKGQFVYHELQNLLFFCANPWLNADTNIRELNLNISDFSVQSAVVENTQFLGILFEELKSKIELSEDFENQRKFFERLYDEIPVDMSIIDLDKRFRYLNKRAVKDDKLRKWMVGKTNSDYFILKNIDKEIGFKREVFIQQAIDTDSMVSFEDVHHKGTEKEVIMLRSVSPFTAYDGLRYLLAYGQEITDLKKNAKLAEQKNLELEKLNLELNNIIYSITHDFRSPILAVKALVELMKKSVMLNERFEEFLDMITNSIDKLDDQIIDIFHFVKNVNAENRFSIINIEEIVIEIFDMVRYSVSYPIELRIDIDEKVNFYSDAYRIKILLNNLISNAVKYSSNRDNNAFVEFITRVDENEAVFYIKDNGEGIPDQLKEKVFEIYFRASNSSSGTGLGLFICSQVLKKLNGIIELESAVGKGSTFIVSIPNNRQ